MKKAITIALVCGSLISAAPVQAGLLSTLAAAAKKILPDWSQKKE